MKLKRRLIDDLVSLLEPFQKVRREYENNMDEVYKIVKNSNEIARAKASETLKKVREAIGVDYFR